MRNKESVKQKSVCNIRICCFTLNYLIQVQEKTFSHQFVHKNPEKKLHKTFREAFIGQWRANELQLKLGNIKNHSLLHRYICFTFFFLSSFSTASIIKEAFFIWQAWFLTVLISLGDFTYTGKKAVGFFIFKKYYI